MKQSPFMRAHFAHDNEMDQLKRDAAAEAERKEQVAAKQKAELTARTDIIFPLVERSAKDAEMICKVGEASRQVWSSHAAVSLKAGLLREGAAIADFVIRLEADDRVSVRGTLGNPDPQYGGQQITSEDLGQVDNSDLSERVDESLGRAIQAAMKAVESRSR